MTTDTRTIDQLIPADDNVRTTTITEASVVGLAQSIAIHGVLQPLRVTVGGTIIAGHRRYRAIALAIANGDLPKTYEIPVTFSEAEPDSTATQVQRLIENLQRSDLTPMEEAFGFYRLTVSGMTQAELAAEVGLSKSHVSKRLSLLLLNEKLQAKVSDGTLPMDRALLLTKLPDDDQIKLADSSVFSIENHLAKRKAEAKVAKVQDELEALGLVVLEPKNFWSDVEHEGKWFTPDREAMVSIDDWKGGFPKKYKAVAVSLNYRNEVSLTPYLAQKVTVDDDGNVTTEPVPESKADREAREAYEAEVEAARAKREADLKLLWNAALNWGTKELNEILLAAEVHEFWVSDSEDLDAIGRHLGIEYPEDVNRSEYLSELVSIATPANQRKAVLMATVLNADSPFGYGINRIIRAKAGIVDDE